MDDAASPQTASPSLPPPPTKQAGESVRRTPAWAWVTLVALALAVAAAVVMGVMWSNASSDLDDTEAALDTASAELGKARSELTDATEELGQATSDLEESEARAEAAEREAESANELASSASSDADELEARFEGLEDMLEIAFSSDSNRPADTEAARCILDEVGIEGVFASILIAGDPAIAAQFDPDLLGSVGAAGIRCGGSLEVLGPGDDPVLDELYDACAGGDGAACDELFFTSPLGSEYERFAATCGDRFTLADAPLECAGAI